MPWQTVERAHALIDAMLNEMQLGLHDPSYCTTEEWEKLFGSKQSMVANLQKLVGTLAILPEDAPDVETAHVSQVPPITPEEMELLKAWLADAP